MKFVSDCCVGYLVANTCNNRFGMANEFEFQLKILTNGVTNIRKDEGNNNKKD